VSFEPESDIGGAARLLATVDYYGSKELQRLPVTTVTEAVDVLVALGFLPARFSSAYRSGWDKANGFALARAAHRWIPPTDYAACAPATEAVF
jgi:hypothetical protein